MLPCTSEVLPHYDEERTLFINDWFHGKVYGHVRVCSSHRPNCVWLLLSRTMLLLASAS